MVSACFLPSLLPLSLRQSLDPRIAGKTGDQGEVGDVAKAAAEETDMVPEGTPYLQQGWESVLSPNCDHAARMVAERITRHLPSLRRLRREGRVWCNWEVWEDAHGSPDANLTILNVRNSQHCPGFAGKNRDRDTLLATLGWLYIMAGLESLDMHVLQPWDSLGGIKPLQSISVSYLKEKAQITTDVSMLIKDGRGLLKNDFDKPLASMKTV